MQELQGSKGDKVSITVPVYNEALHIQSSLKAMIGRLEELSLDFELIVVESGSSDNSRAIIDEMSVEDKRIKLIHQEKREGMGSAIACGFGAASGSFLFWMDADMPYDLLFLKKGIALIEDADLIAGYRKSRDEPFKRKLYSKVFNILANLFFNIGLRDINFAFKLFRREVFKNIAITSKSSFFAAEILAKCRRNGLRIKQLPVDYNPRKSGDSKLGNMKTIMVLLKEMIRFRLFGKA